MFDSMVAIELGYGSEVWGYVNGDDVEVVHITIICKRTLRAKNNSVSSNCV
jgi:hypothetical protein